MWNKTKSLYDTHIGIRNMKSSSFLKKESWRASLQQHVKEKGTISLSLECMVAS